MQAPGQGQNGHNRRQMGARRRRGHPQAPCPDQQRRPRRVLALPSTARTPACPPGPLPRRRHARSMIKLTPGEPHPKAVAHHTDSKWVLIYVERWLKAPMLMPDGTLKHRTMGTPQGGPITPPTQWATRRLVTLRVGCLVFLVAVAGSLADGDAVPDGDL